MKTIYRVKSAFGTTVFKTTDPLTAGAYAAASNGAQSVCHTPTKFEIELLKAQGLTAHGAYEQATGTAGIYGIAFFGHKGSAEDRRTLKAIQDRIAKVYY